MTIHTRDTIENAARILTGTRLQRIAPETYALGMQLQTFSEILNRIDNPETINDVLKSDTARNLITLAHFVMGRSARNTSVTHELTTRLENEAPSVDSWNAPKAATIAESAAQLAALKTELYDHLQDASPKTYHDRITALGNEINALPAEARKEALVAQRSHRLAR